MKHVHVQDMANAKLISYELRRTTEDTEDKTCASVILRK